MKTVRNIFLTLVIGFFAFNLILLGRYAIRENNLSRPHVKAKVLLSWAEMVNEVYIFPASLAYMPHDINIYNPPWWKPIILFPAYLIRDALYNAGINEIPADDGERDYWWTRIHFAEYRTIYVRPFRRFVLSPAAYGLPIFKRQIEELYNHLKELARHKRIADSKVRISRLDDYSGLAMYFFRDNEDFYSWALSDRYRHYSPDLTFYGLFLKNKEQAARIEKVLQGWLDLKQAVLSNNPQAYQAFHSSGSSLKEPLLVYEATVMLLAHRILRKEMQCSDPLIHLYQESLKLLPKVSYDREPAILRLPQEAAQESTSSYLSVYAALKADEQSRLVEDTLKEKCF